MAILVPELNMATERTSEAQKTDKFM
jgi:hypothetical protein